MGSGDFLSPGKTDKPGRSNAGDGKAGRGLCLSPVSGETQGPGLWLEGDPEDQLPGVQVSVGIPGTQKKTTPPTFPLFGCFIHSHSFSQSVIHSSLIRQHFLWLGLWLGSRT